MKYPVIDRSFLPGETCDEWIDRLHGWSWQKDDESDEEWMERIAAQREADKETWRKGLSDDGELYAGAEPLPEHLKDYSK